MNGHVTSRTRTLPLGRPTITKTPSPDDRRRRNSSTVLRSTTPAAFTAPVSLSAPNHAGRRYRFGRGGAASPAYGLRVSRRNLYSSIVGRDDPAIWRSPATAAN